MPTTFPYHPELHRVVIGYGNELRSDDAVGLYAAAAVAAWDMPDVQTFAVHQLTPELAEVLATAGLAIFVDARISLPAQQERGTEGEDQATLSVQQIAPAALASSFVHTSDPRALLALTEALYGRCPVAWAIGVPAQRVTFGAGLSPVAKRGLADAIEWIGDRLQGNEECTR